MSDSRANRVVDVELDEESIQYRSAESEHERNVAIFDMLEGNSFQHAGTNGPYR
ncbi:MAG: UPF0262 family protein, partial [Reyranellaceae bacterium]